MIKKAFTLLETLITLLIISSMFVITINKVSDINLDWIYFGNEYLYKQADSLFNKVDNEVNDYYSNSYIHFNANGKVNKAQTITIGNKKIIIHLGTGYFTYE